MDGQDWTTVTVRRRQTKKEAVARGRGAVQVRDSGHDERVRIAKLESEDIPAPRKHVTADSLQALIRKRVEMKLTQEKADALFSFPRNTFRNLEAQRLTPTQEQMNRIHNQFGLHIKLETI